MNSKIHRLHPEVAEKIAAGEVIERPFSIVKELVENSLDAAASRIEIFIEEGGKNLIRIQDDGIGMAPEEMALALERHATSKIRSFEDLYSLSTLGFRGEALPSISAVSKFSLKSRPKEGSRISGYEIYLEGGKIIRQQEIGHPVGTTITIQDLFFNTPVRLKFLKSKNTEWSHIEDYITSMALAYPQVQWIVHHDQKEKIRWVQKELSQRMIEIWGSEVADQFYPLNYERGELRLSGYVGHPNLSQSQSKSQFVFLNHRPLKDRLLNHAILSGYRSLLMKDQFPFVVLFLEIPPSFVDVNVHPTKREVRFTNPNLIHQFVSDSIRDYLSRAPWQKENSFLTSFESNSQSPQKEEYRERIEGNIREFMQREAYSTPSLWKENSQNLNSLNTLKKEIYSIEKEEENSFKFGRLPFSSLQVIGQLKKTYILCESDDHLVLIDQHAAHERIGFERFRQGYQSNSLRSQQLLIPQIVELRESEKEILVPHLDSLLKLGLEIEEFGEKTIVVKGAPSLLGEIEVSSLIRALLIDLESHGSSERLEDSLDEIFATMACHRQIRAGDSLSLIEMKELINQLDEGAYTYHCPHGRPVMVQITYREIEKWFKRIV